MVAVAAASGWRPATSTPAKVLATAGKSHQYSEQTRENALAILRQPTSGASIERQQPPQRRRSAWLVPALTSEPLLPIAATARRDRRGPKYRQHSPARCERWTAAAVNEWNLRGAGAAGRHDHLTPGTASSALRELGMGVVRVFSQVIAVRGDRLSTHVTFYSTIQLDRIGNQKM